MSRLEELKRRNPEWRPWLAVLGEALAEIEDRGWDAAVPRSVAQPEQNAPLLARATLDLDARAFARFLEKLARSAGASGAPRMAGMERLECSQALACAVLRTALDGDDERLARLAHETGVDAQAFGAVAALVPMPFLHACARRWTSQKAAGWSPGYCPVCGAWPAFAEILGVERARFLRCAGCGSAWQVHCLACPYCALTDHEKLGSLATEQSAAKCAIEVCSRCLGYVKAFTRLRPGPPAEVLLDDLGSVEFDLAAADRGYRRPPGRGYALRVTLAGDDASHEA